MILNFLLPSALVGDGNLVSRFVLVRPGATEFDDQRRIKGCLDIPLSSTGREQVERIVQELAELDIDQIVAAPCGSAMETANRLADGRAIKVKVLDSLRNVDHGLWHGKLIDEVRRNHPSVYKQGVEAPLQISLPGGETLETARVRVTKALKKLTKRGSGETIALVVPDPLASIVHSVLEGEDLGDLWKAETDAATWELIDC